MSSSKTYYVATAALYFCLNHLSAAASSSELLEKGQYLAKAGNCASCHTEKQGEPFAGGVKFVTSFGTLYSTNITQDKETGIGNWSLEEFSDSLRQGVRPNGDHLYPVFPYTSFAKLNDDDIAALYAYMKTIKAVSKPARANELEFPYSIRALLAGWKYLYLDEGPYQPDSTQSPEWNRGAYLVEGAGHCGTCHTPRNFLGAKISDQALSGAVYNDEVAKDKYRQWSGVNLTSSIYGLSTWNTDDLHDYLKTGTSKNATTFGPMNDVIMNSLRHLNDDDVRAMAIYLKRLPAIDTPSDPVPSQQVMAAGERAYTLYCGTCHLPSGLGGPTLGTPLVGNPIVLAQDPSSLINATLYGAQLPPAPFTSGREAMTSLAVEMSDEDVAAVSSYVRASWGHSAGEVTAEDVAKQR